MAPGTTDGTGGTKMKEADLPGFRKFRKQRLLYMSLALGCIQFLNVGDMRLFHHHPKFPNHKFPNPNPNLAMRLFHQHLMALDDSEDLSDIPTIAFFRPN